MQVIEIKRTKLIADEGKILTNGESYVTETFLAEGMSQGDYHEITMEEYQEKRSQDDKDLSGGVE